MTPEDYSIRPPSEPLSGPIPIADRREGAGAGGRRKAPPRRPPHDQPPEPEPKARDDDDGGEGHVDQLV